MKFLMVTLIVLALLFGAFMCQVAISYARSGIIEPPAQWMYLVYVDCPRYERIRNVNR